MKILETKIYSFSELSEAAKAKVLENHSTSVYSDPEDFTLDGCADSLKAICEAMGTPLLDWSIGPNSRGNYAKVENPYQTEPQEYYGARLDEGGRKAILLFVSMLEREGYPKPEKFGEMKFEGLCKFTGCGYDDDLSEYLLSELVSGETWNASVDSCAEYIAGIAERDLAWRASEEAFAECDEGEEIYTEIGSTF